MMTNTHARQGRWLVCISLATCLAMTANIVRAEDDFLGTDRAEIRGQSPYGYGRLSPSLPSESTTPFRSATNPWIIASQETAAPTFGSGSPAIAQTLPADPFGQPYMGEPLYGDPGLGGLYLNQPAVWQPYVAAQGKAGNESSGAFGQLMMPLYQDGQSLFFADIRGRFDDSSNSEGNFGLALRSMVDPTWFVGLYGFYDYKRTEAGNHFSQGTLGIEAMSVRYEARLNGYIPESGAKKANSASTTEFEAGTIFVKGGLERAYYGVDGELGALLWEDWAGNLEFRGFVGGYWFDTDGANFPSVAGPKGRLEMRMYDLSCFGPESRLTLGVEVQNDSVRDFQISGLARLEIPLGVFPGSRKLTRLERRMLDRIVRDDDIITVTGQGPREVGIDSLTKRPLINVIEAKGGDDVSAIVNGAAANSTILANGIAGPLNANATMVMKPGQVFRGGGFQVVGSQTGATAVYGTRPTINNALAGNDTVVLNDFTTVADLDLVGGQNGISSEGIVLDQALVSGNTVTNSAQSAYRFSLLDSATVIQNNKATGAVTGSGFQFDGPMNATVRGNTATGSVAGEGFTFNNFIGPAAQVTGNTATNNAGTGFHFNVLDLGGIIANNTSTGNAGNGFQFDGPVIGVVSGNKALNNAGDGFQFNSLVFGNVSGNQASNNAGVDFLFNGPVIGTVDGNISSGTAVKGTDGFRFNAPVIGFVSNNTSSDNTNDGFFFQSLALGTIAGNTATNNGGNGYNFVGPVVGVVANNSATGNTLDGFQFGSAVAASVAGNTASNNGGDGFDILALVLGGEVVGNKSTSNLGDGFVFQGLVGTTTTVSGNISTGNGFGPNGAVVNNSSGFHFIGPVNGIVRDNRSDGNTLYGYDLDNGLGVTGLVSGNSAANNTAGGFAFVGNISGIVDKNIATGSTSVAAGQGYGFDFTTANLLAGARVTENISSHNRVGFGFNGTNATTVINGNTASFNGFTTGGALFDATGNGFEWIVANSNAVVTNNFALSNANNGFSGTADNAVNNAGTFQNNLSNTNGDRGYIVTNPTPNNLGSGNVNGNDTAP